MGQCCVAPKRDNGERYLPGNSSRIEISNRAVPNQAQFGSSQARVSFRAVNSHNALPVIQNSNPPPYRMDLYCIML